MTDGSKDNGRDDRGRFTLGNPGGPGGPRRRQSELRRAAEEAVTPERVAAMMRKATLMALEGDTTAMRLVLDRVCGRATEAPTAVEPIGIALPRFGTAADCDAAVERLVEGICQGTVDREAAKLLIDVIQARLKAIEVKDLEERLSQLEETTNHVAGRRA